MCSRALQAVAGCVIAGASAFTAFNVSAQTFEQEFAWLGQSLTVPDACFDENWRFIRITEENTETCWRLSPEMVQAFNIAVADPENFPMPVNADAVAPIPTVNAAAGALDVLTLR